MREEIIELASRRSMGQHPGLLLQRYLVPPQDDSDKAKQAEKRQLLNAARQAAGSVEVHELYTDAFNRWITSFPENGLHPVETLKTVGRLIVGLGTENVLETGLRLHHTYGIPTIPGSALKGLTAHYCRDVWGQRRSSAVADDNLPYQRGGQFHDLVFGTTDDGGVITFHDAWVTPDSLRDGAIQLDVMTPHHPKWQLGPKNRDFAAPTDFDSPIPVSFLSVTGTFQIRLSWNGPTDTSQELAVEWIQRTITILKEALAEWGVGGKTSSGYGRFGQASKPQTNQGTVPGQSAKPIAPTHGPREKVRVIQRTIGGKIRYEADDGFLGSLLSGTPPALADGEATELWIARVDDKNKKIPYVFQIDEPKPPKPQPPRNDPRGGKGKR